MAEISFTEAAVDDLRRIGPDAVPKVLKKVLLLEDNPEAGYPLGGERAGFRKLVVGRNTWRIVYRITDDKAVLICEVAVNRRPRAAYTPADLGTLGRRLRPQRVMSCR